MRSFASLCHGRSRGLNGCSRASVVGLALAGVIAGGAAALSAAEKAPLDFNRDVRPILSNNCFTCHGPDGSKREAGLRLDVAEGALAPADSGARAVVPGRPEQSELLRRVASEDETEQMPPAETGKKLNAREIAVLTEWVRQGGVFAKHWSYVLPARPAPAPVPASLAGAWAGWPRNDIDRFVLARLGQEGLRPSPEADRATLIRRAALDLTGLPPTMEEVERFVNDADAQAYETMIDRLLAKPAYGEHWARQWLDLARYADSAGYADDPPRTIWAYRDWVIRAYNDNLPFDRFTLEQIAGDLLPSPTDDQLVATAFHRNTLTNNEGGTNDEEFRNVAIVDRVNTTMAVWMGATFTCAQCHNHKYDPLSQEEFFRVFAVFNNTEDADRGNEAPLLSLMTAEQRAQQESLARELAAIEKELSTPTAELAQAQAEWERALAAPLDWRVLTPREAISREGAPVKPLENGAVLVGEARPTDALALTLPLTGESAPRSLAAIRLETLPHETLPGRGAGHANGNFVVTRVGGALVPPETTRPRGRYVRVTLPGEGKFLSLAEVEVLSGGDNIARRGAATQSSTAYEGPAHLAIDGNTDGVYASKSTTHTDNEANPWWEVDLKSEQPIDRVALWNRLDGVGDRLAGYRVSVLNTLRETVWEKTDGALPSPGVELAVGNAAPLRFVAAFADYAQSGFEAANVLSTDPKNTKGWSVGGQTTSAHALTLLLEKPVEIPAGAVLSLTVEQNSKQANHTLGHFRVAASADARAGDFARLPADVLEILRTDANQRSPAQEERLAKYYVGDLAAALAPRRARLAELKKQLADLKPATTVPIMRELAGNARRKTRVQHRGNFLDLGAETQPGVPAAWHALPQGANPDRLALARWLVAPDNPLTARVLANRYWEAVFGQGIVVTSEEFGSQGEAPTHPELLDWLATEMVRLNWDTKAFLKLLTTSAAYRQSSRVTPELLERDPENTLLARGPRVRLTAEMIRDQALAASGLLSPKMYGPPVKPPQPSIGLSAAFGGGIDWQTSAGEDKFRRGLYTTWRRSNPYPSMAAFDAPNREVCTLRRPRSNTPLQALVTLNDPVYVEAAQALGRRAAASTGGVADKAAFAFRACLARSPSESETQRLVELHARATAHFAQAPEAAKQMATQPLGPAPQGANVVDLAAWTVVGNVLLNLDEMFMKR